MGHILGAPAHIQLTSPTAGKADLYLFQREGLGWAAHLVTHKGKRAEHPVEATGNYGYQAVGGLATRKECAPWAPFLRGQELAMRRTGNPQLQALNEALNTPSPTDDPDLLA